MTINELATVTGLRVDVQWNEGLGKFQVWLRNGSRSVEIQDGIMLVGAWGGGKSRKDAIEDYCLQIQGKTIVVNAYGGEKRREISVPTSLIYEDSLNDKPATNKATV